MHIHTSNQETLRLGFGGYTCNWGVHMCGLFETDEERDTLLYNFLHQGDVDGERVRYYHSDATPGHFKEEYARRFPTEANHPDDPSRFALMSARERCYPSGQFEPLAQDPKLRALREQAMTTGQKVRGIGEMDWASGGVPGCELLLPYEARLNGLFQGAPMLIMCIYDLRKFPGATIMGVLRTHRFTVSQGMIVENPYYNPEQILADSGLRWPPLVG